MFGLPRSTFITTRRPFSSVTRCTERDRFSAPPGDPAGVANDVGETEPAAATSADTNHARRQDERATMFFMLLPSVLPVHTFDDQRQISSRMLSLGPGSVNLKDEKPVRCARCRRSSPARRS